MPKNYKQSRNGTPKVVETIIHDDKRKNIPTAEYQAVVDKETAEPIRVAYERRNRDLDPQLVWRGKDEQDWSDLVVHAPPSYIQEKVHPKALIEDLKRASRKPQTASQPALPDLFSDFNGIPEGADKTDFYKHENNWSNRMILGDSLQVMASLAEREGLRGQVQCIYIDPPYGIKFNSNFQWSTTSREVKDGSRGHITREPEMVRAFRDTWRDGVHTYLSYLRDRLTLARDMLKDSGSIFVQIGDENVHRIRALLDEVFGEDNFISVLTVQKTGTVTGQFIQSNADYIVWYARHKPAAKFNPLFLDREGKPDKTESQKTSAERSDFSAYPLTSDGFRETTTVKFIFEGKSFFPGATRHWGVTIPELERAGKAGRIMRQETQIRMKYFWDDFPVVALGSYWNDVGGATGKVYVVQTSPKVVERCLLSVTDPGDLVLDPTCGAGTTAYVAEQWGRRWVTIDTSRVALALARARLMGANYSYYILADSPDGLEHEARAAKTPLPASQTFGDLRRGFVYQRVPHLTLGNIARNTEIDVIWSNYENRLRALLDELNELSGHSWAEWDMPQHPPESLGPAEKHLFVEWWRLYLQRQRELDASVTANAEIENLVDQPYRDNKRVRVAGPFTVESLTPYRHLDAGADFRSQDACREDVRGFAAKILTNLERAGVQQTHKDDKIDFVSLLPWPGRYICAEGTYTEGRQERRAGVFIGPEYGTVSRPDLVEAAREAGDADFDVLIACAFNFDAHSSEFDKLGRIPVLKARMNADLHMADELKSTGKGNLFVIFGEPDIDIEEVGDQLQVKIKGVDVFDPQTGEIRSDSSDGIACWFIDTDYNGESFFVRHAYFLGRC